LMLRFQSARDLLPAHPVKAVEALDGALDRADQAIAEGLTRFRICDRLR
jgi:hypothetical protein